MYIPLHVHSARASIGDSILKIKEYVKKAKEMGLTHIAVTNHGSMADMYNFYYECINNDIAPIIGCEVYVVNNKEEKIKGEKYNHLVLIAKDEEGLKNLLYITSDANLRGMYYKPRTDLATIALRSKGLICLSACLGGDIPQDILKLKDMPAFEAQEAYQEIQAKVLRYKCVFKNNYYLEIQPGTFADQIYVNQILIQLSQETDVPLVMTNDIHYLDEEDYLAHDIHVKIERKMNIDDNMIYPDTCYYLMNEQRIKTFFEYANPDVIQRAINHTVHIANQCSIKLEIDKLHMPQFPVPRLYSEDDYLASIALKRLNEISSRIPNPTQYMERTLYELNVLKELGFSGYFLTVRDFVHYAGKNDIPVGPGRGSVCGSLVAYLLGITKVDPIKYNLLFERFLSVHRKGSVPDIDLDFSSEKRNSMFDYAISKHGQDRCALVSTVGLRKAKAALRDVARVFGIELEVADQAAKLIPVAFYDEEGNKATDLSIADSLKIVPELRQMHKQYPEWFNMAMKLEDLPRVSSVHAAGTLVAPVSLIDYIPLRQKSEESTIFATSLNLGDAETAGFIKFDFLGLATLSVIDNTERETGFRFDFDNDDLYEDASVWNLIGSKNTTTLFQIGSRTYKDRMCRLQPKTIKELAACLALVRGPCISSKADQIYMEIVEGKREKELIHDFYDRATAETNGILLYQEQLMNIAVNFGFSLEESFKLMKAVAKKKIDKIAEYEADFRKLADENNVPDDATDKIWQIILDAGLYCFNESHAIAYALLCYQSAYLKTYFPLQYMANSLTNAYERKEEIEETVAECRRLGIKFNGLDYNESVWGFSINESLKNTINIGLCAIKGFGDKASFALIANRPYVSFEDMIERVPKKELSKRAIVPAIFSGLFDSIAEKESVYRRFCDLRKEDPLTEIKIARESIDLESSSQDIEKFVLGCALVTSPVNDFIPIGFDELRPKQVFTTKAVISRVKKLKDRNGNHMAFLTLETGDGIIDGTVFATNYKQYRSFYKKGLIVDIKGKKDKEGSCLILEIS